MEDDKLVLYRQIYDQHNKTQYDSNMIQYDRTGLNIKPMDSSSFNACWLCISFYSIYIQISYITNAIIHAYSLNMNQSVLSISSVYTVLQKSEGTVWKFYLNHLLGFAERCFNKK